MFEKYYIIFPNPSPDLNSLSPELTLVEWKAFALSYKNDFPELRSPTSSVGQRLSSFGHWKSNIQEKALSPRQGRTAGHPSAWHTI